jgi:hypothetical protein
MTPASVNDTNYLPYCTVYSRHTKQPIDKVYADKGYAGTPNRQFLADNEIADGIMRKDSTTAKLTQLNTFEDRLLRNLTGQAELEIKRNNKIFTPLNLFSFYLTGVQGSLYRRTILWNQSSA